MLGQILSGLTGLGGLLGASAAQQKYQAEEQQAIQQLNLANMTQYNNMVNQDKGNLATATGEGGDYVQQLGQRLGDSLASAGVYNSSALAGTLAKAQANTQSQLKGLAAQDQYNEQSLLDQNQKAEAQMQYGFAASQLGQANQQYNQSVGGLSSLLGSVAQKNLMASGANANKAALPQINGNQNQGQTQESEAVDFGNTQTGMDDNSAAPSFQNGQWTNADGSPAMFGPAAPGGAQSQINYGAPAGAYGGGFLPDTGANEGWIFNLAQWLANPSVPVSGR